MKLKHSQQCLNCKDLLESLSDRQVQELDVTEQLIKNKSLFGDFSNGTKNTISYSHLVNENTKLVFIKINERFREALKSYMNPEGESIMKNIVIWLRRDLYIKSWADEIVQCRLHRKIMIELFIRAKIYQIIKHKNQLSYIMAKSFNQTRRQLRHQ